MLIRNTDFFSKTVREVRNISNFSPGDSEFLSSKIPPHPPVLKALAVVVEVPATVVETGTLRDIGQGR